MQRWTWVGWGRHHQGPFFFFFRLVFNQNNRIPLLLAGGPEGKEEEMRSSSSLGTKENAAKANCLLSVIENSRSTLGRKSNPLISCSLANKTVRNQRIKPQEIFCSRGAEQRVTESIFHPSQVAFRLKWLKSHVSQSAFHSGGSDRVADRSLNVLPLFASLRDLSRSPAPGRTGSRRQKEPTGNFKFNWR